jgi:hypothetical protein
MARWLIGRAAHADRKAPTSADRPTSFDDVAPGDAGPAPRRFLSTTRIDGNGSVCCPYDGRGRRPSPAPVGPSQQDMPPPLLRCHRSRTKGCRGQSPWLVSFALSPVHSKHLHRQRRPTPPHTAGCRPPIDPFGVPENRLARNGRGIRPTWPRVDVVRYDACSRLFSRARKQAAQ